jgi:hypothetical protein
MIVEPEVLTPALFQSRDGLVFVQVDMLVGQVGDKGLNFRCAHIGGMAHAMEGDMAFDPTNVGLLPSVDSGQAVRME